MMSLTPDILVYEFFSGGGWPEPDLPPSLAAEGLAMLQAVLADFRSWGRARIITTRDHRLADVILPADQVMDLEPANHQEALAQLAGKVKAALIIAPEINGVLANLSDLMEAGGARLLGSRPQGVKIAANKWSCYQLFVKAGLPTPETWRVAVARAGLWAERIGFPLVIKPEDGAGCQGVNLIENGPALAAILAKWPHGDHVLLQRYIEGDHASASVLVAGGRVRLLSLNSQLIEVGAPFHYRGGRIPHGGDRYEEVEALVEKTLALAPGLQGYVGLDLLLSGQKVYLLEINPRLTTSYIGLRSVIDLNLAAAIYQACLENVLPVRVRLTGSTLFTA